MKYSFHSWTLCKPTNFSIIFDCRLKRLPQLFQLAWDHYTALLWKLRKHCFHNYPNSTLIVACLFIAAGTCLPSRCLAVNIYSGFQASCHAVILKEKIIGIWNGQIFHSGFSCFVKAWIFWMGMYTYYNNRIIILDAVCHLLNIINPSVSETEFVSIIRCKGGKFPTNLCPLERANFNCYVVFEKIQDHEECLKNSFVYCGYFVCCSCNCCCYIVIMITI
jgi:hypothetical protein